MNNMEIKVSVKDIPEVIEQLQKAEDKINNLQSKIDKAIEILESQLPICVMPNNMLIHGTEKAKAIEEVLNILKEDK